MLSDTIFEATEDIRRDLDARGYEGEGRALVERMLIQMDTVQIWLDAPCEISIERAAEIAAENAAIRQTDPEILLSDR